MTEEEQYKAVQQFLIEHPEIDLIDIALRIEGEKIVEKAKDVAEQYYGARDLITKKMAFSDRGLISVSVKPRKSGTCEIAWIKLKHIPKNRREGMSGRKSLCQYIKKGIKRDDYPRTHVIRNNSKAHETELFEEFEPLFARVRRQSRLLGSLMRSHKDYLKSLDESI